MMELENAVKGRCEREQHVRANAFRWSAVWSVGWSVNRKGAANKSVMNIEFGL